MKFPTERKLTYATGAISNGNFARVGNVCIPKDLSIVNRRGYDMTTQAGVPLIYKVAVHWYPGGLDGSGYVVNTSTDVRTTVKFMTVPNTWVSKNAGIAWHKARLAGMKRHGITKKMMGAYAKTIRYELEGSSTTWLDPVDANSSAYSGGTWDSTEVFNSIDENGFKLRLLGNGNDEDSVLVDTDINAIFSYMQSRSTVPADSNLESSSVPSVYGMLKSTELGSDADTDESRYLKTNVRGAQDNPPYEAFDGATLEHDITEPSEASRFMYPAAQSGVITTIFEAPYGVFAINAANRDPDDNSGVVDDMSFSVEVLGIYEMQG